MMESALYFGIGLLGLLAHFLKQKVKGQTAQEVTQWFAGHFKDTVLSLLLYIASFALLSETGQMGFFAAFSAGYMADSIFARKQEDK